MMKNASIKVETLKKHGKWETVIKKQNLTLTRMKSMITKGYAKESLGNNDIVEFEIYESDWWGGCPRR